MQRLLAASCVLIAMMTAALAASGRQPAPPGAFAGAPPQYTQFSTAELSRGFLALAFGSDLRIGARPTRHPPLRSSDQCACHRWRQRRSPGGDVARHRRLRACGARAASERDIGEPADIEVRLIDEKDFQSALQAAFGAKIARTFVTRTDPQCMTSVKSTADGEIVRSVSFIIVDKGDDVFLDCAYHELLHAFGLSNHDQRNPWTTLNQKRMVGYLTVYDRALLTLLYDPRISPGMTVRQARAVLPRLIATSASPGRRQAR